MNPTLEDLLKLLDAYLDGNPAQAEDRFNAYQARIHVTPKHLAR